MKGLKILIIIGFVSLVIFCLAFLSPYLGILFTPKPKATSTVKDLKPMDWFPIGKKMKFISEKGETYTLEAKEIETTVEMSYASGKYQTLRNFWVDDGKSKFIFTDFSITSAVKRENSNGNQLTEEAIEDEFVVAQFNLINHSGFRSNLESYNVGDNFSTSIVINNKTYLDISYSERIEPVDDGSMGDYGYGIKINDVHPNYTIIRESGGGVHYINSKVWWSKTLGLMRFQRNKDAVIFTRVF
jgi:hypothetical protein